jgi:hypothetical protein
LDMLKVSKVWTWFDFKRFGRLGFGVEWTYEWYGIEGQGLKGFY